MRIENEPEDRILFTDENFGHALGIGRGTGAVGADALFNCETSSILIGRFCSLANKIYFIMGANHPYKNVTTFPFYLDFVVESVFGNVKLLPFKVPNHYQVILGHDVWLGYGVKILSGVKIGNGAVVGAGAVVAKDIPPYAIAVGNPARVIKYRFDGETIKKLLAVKWWNWDLKKIADNVPLMANVEKFLAIHCSPPLENFPEDDLSRLIENFGGRVYQFIADFRAARPLWKKVVRDFCRSDFEKNLLVIYLGRDATEENFQSLAAEVNRFDDRARKNILLITTGDKNFSVAALRKGTHFITSREMVTLEALDYLWNTDVKIISALDDGIFEG